MKILITGGAGFIGSHLAEAVCHMGASVVILDNLELGDVRNLQWAKSGTKLEFVEGDVRNAGLVTRLVQGCDWVFHEAALPSVPRSVLQPLETNEQNVTGTLNLLIAARDAGVKRFLFASSSSIYGDTDAPLKHEGLPPNPMSPYALQKYAGEHYCQLFHRLYGLPTVALRYFNVFGPRQRHDSPYSGVIARFCTAFLRGEQPTIYGDGLQSRDFTYIENVVRANLLAAQAPVEKVAGRVMNIACGESISLLQLVAELQILTGQKLEPRFESGRAGDVRSSRADVQAARESLKFEPAVAFPEGLRRTLDFYRSPASDPDYSRCPAASL